MSKIKDKWQQAISETASALMNNEKVNSFFCLHNQSAIIEELKRIFAPKEAFDQLYHEIDLARESL